MDSVLIPHPEDIKLRIMPIQPLCGLSQRQAEQSAVEMLAREIFGSEAIVRHHPDGAPYIPGYGGHISISHGAGIAAIAVSDSAPVGVDVECWRQQLHRVAAKFLSRAELAAWSASPDALLRAWTIKEAVYKAALTPGLPLHAISLPHDICGAVASAGNRDFSLHTSRYRKAVITTALAI